MAQRSTSQRRARHRTSRLASAFLLFTWWALSACVIPLGSEADGRLRNLVVAGFAATNEEAGSSRRVVLGADLRLAGYKRGVSLGYSDLRVCVAPTSAQSSKEAVSAPRFEWPLAISWNDEDGTRRLLGIFAYEDSTSSAEVAFVHHVGVGAGVDVGTVVRGLAVGFVSQTLLRIPLDRSRLYRLRYRSRSPVSGEPCLEEE